MSLLKLPQSTAIIITTAAVLRNMLLNISNFVKQAANLFSMALAIYDMNHTFKINLQNKRCA